MPSNSGRHLAYTEVDIQPLDVKQCVLLYNCNLVESIARLSMLFPALPLTRGYFELTFLVPFQFFYVLK